VISVVIITFNEEANIRRCIDAARSVADEIIVVDSLSTDQTPEICKELNVNFFSRKWEGYSKTKNFGNKQAQHSYILSIDADEVISDELRQSILKQKETLSGVYQFNRLTNYAGKWVHHCGWYPDAKVRLFPKDKAYWEGDFVHETLRIHSELEIKRLQGDLLHYSYKSIEDHKNRISKYSDLHAQKMFSEGKKAGIVKLLMAPVAKFFRDYFINLGFLDGKTGFIICRLSALAVYKKYHKLRSLYGKHSV
jgi:glycosyltransferase involved in cell wall biosynthesis